MNENQVVFILGLGHSGGTLLGNVLDVHPRVLHVGEVLTPLVKGHPFRCYYCGESSCPIWGDVLPEAFVWRCYNNFLRQKRGRWHIVSPLMETLRLQRGPGELYERVFSRLPHINVIIDKSQHMDWIRWNSKSSGFQSRYLLLVRDLRGVVSSWFRKYPEKSVREWAVNQRRTLENALAFYEKQDNTLKATVRYEDLVLRPEETLTGLCEFLGLSYTPDFLEYFRFDHHIIGGNRKVAFESLYNRNAEVDHLLVGIKESDIHEYYRGLPGFRLDSRWKEDLREADLRAIEDEAGELQQRFGYSREGSAFWSY